MGAVTIHDVAERAGVSIKTVSRVMNGERAVSADTRARVAAAVQALDYRPNVSARSLAGARTYLIGLISDASASPAYVSGVQLGAAARCRHAGRHLIIETLDSRVEDAAAAVRRLIATLRPDGLILTPPICDDDAVLDLLESAQTPFVRIAPNRETARAARVHMDDAGAAYALTRRLIELGHRDIGFIHGPPAHGAAHRRFEGFGQALSEAGLSVDPRRVAHGEFTFRSGLACAAVLLGGEAGRPTAIFAANDDMALGVLSAAYGLGLAIPEALSVAGFDDTPAALVVWPQLTTVRQPLAEMAAEAVDILVARETRAQRLMPFEIVMRDSTGPAPR